MSDRASQREASFFAGYLLMALQHLSDESVLTLYENIREQVSADIRLGSQHRLLGETARQQELRLREELERRGLRFTPIDWR
jgi:hypothetical protein